MQDLTKFSDYQLREFIEAYKIILSSILTDQDFNVEDYKECMATIKELQEELSKRKFT